VKQAKLNETYFQVLGVNRSSTKEEIRIAYLKEIKKWHPDKFVLNSKEYVRATELSKKINEAYQVLKDYEPIPKEDRCAGEARRGGTRNAGAHKASTDYKGGFIKVESTMVNAVAYKAETQTLIVEHKNKLLYEYYDVPPTVFINFLLSQSKGKFMMKYIRDIYYYKIKYPR
jgi:DnaJ-class molecular chaperone